MNYYNKIYYTRIGGIVKRFFAWRYAIDFIEDNTWPEGWSMLSDSYGRTDTPIGERARSGIEWLLAPYGIRLGVCIVQARIRLLYGVMGGGVVKR